MKVSAAIVRFALGVAALSLVLLAGCRQQESLEARVEKLPPLPKELADALDPKTRATKIPAFRPTLEKAAGLVPAPCCGSKDTRSLVVRFTYTKCAPLRDFIMTPVVGGLVSARLGPGGDPNVGEGKAAGNATGKAYRFGAVDRKSILDTIVCVQSDGPWNAVLTEDRNCGGYSPQDMLLITAFGDLLPFSWNGGATNHPQGIQIVSCRDYGLVRFPCNALSGCDCTSAPCPPEQPCDCSSDW
jgi:hypothetical protein